MSFISFAESHGVLIGNLDDSGRIKRCPTEAHPRSKNGAYMFDGRRGFVFAWDGAAETFWFNDPAAKPWSDAEKREWAERRRAAAAKQDRQRVNAVRAAQQMLASAVVSEHNYLHFKGLPEARGLVLPDGALCVPMRGLDGALQGAQLIRWDYEDRAWEKKMIFGTRAKGAVFRIGPQRAAETVICEGYATGLSIDMAVRHLRLNAAVLVAFNDSNMSVVSGSIKGRKYVFADHDKSGAGERAAISTGLRYCMSEVEGEDANDLHKRAGLTAVCMKLMEARKA